LVRLYLPCYFDLPDRPSEALAEVCHNEYKEKIESIGDTATMDEFIRTLEHDLTQLDQQDNPKKAAQRVLEIERQMVDLVRLLTMI
jgi:hypothetical protein